MCSESLFSRDFELEKIREVPCHFFSSHEKSAFKSGFESGFSSGFRSKAHFRVIKMNSD